jgi:hypothetical protein
MKKPVRKAMLIFWRAPLSRRTKPVFKHHRVVLISVLTFPLALSAVSAVAMETEITIDQNKAMAGGITTTTTQVSRSASLNPAAMF